MTYELTITLEPTKCWCGLTIMVSNNLLKLHEDEGRTLHCPLGHEVIPKSDPLSEAKAETQEAWDNYDALSSEHAAALKEIRRLKRELKPFLRLEKNG